MKVILSNGNGLLLIRNKEATFGGFYEIQKNGFGIINGLCLDAATEIYNNELKQQKS
jgi:hypothetical protein